MRCSRIILAVCLILAGTFGARADSPFVLQPLRVPLAGDLGTLEALFVRPSEPGRYPLALIAHGSGLLRYLKKTDGGAWIAYGFNASTFCQTMLPSVAAAPQAAPGCRGDRLPRCVLLDESESAAARRSASAPA